MQKLIFFILIILPFFGLTQKNYRGLILPEVDSTRFDEAYCCILSPESGFNVYDGAGGKKMGVLKRKGKKEKDDLAPYNIYMIAGNTEYRYEQYDEIDYEIYALMYSDSSNGYVRIADTSNNYWLNVQELKKLGFKPMSWMDFLISICKQGINFFVKEPGLRLRKEPNINSEIIGSMRGELFQVNLTGETFGQWGKVKVIKLKEEPCEAGIEGNIEYETEGWIKVIDDEGAPNLWRYTRGC